MPTENLMSIIITTPNFIGMIYTDGVIKLNNLILQVNYRYNNIIIGCWFGDFKKAKTLEDDTSSIKYSQLLHLVS